MHLFLSQFNINESLAYFSSELSFICAWFVNVFLYFFLKRFYKTRRLSNFITFIAFLLAAIFSLAIYAFKITDIQFSFAFLNNSLNIDSNSFLAKSFLILTFLIFLISQNKVISRFKIQTPFLNSILCLIALFSCLTIDISNDIFAFVCFDIILFLIYKFGSCSRIRKFCIFSPAFILINLIASSIFYYGYYELNYADTNIEFLVINILMFMSFCLKIGIFPFVNYLLIKKNNKNISHLTLLTLFLPCLGLEVFSKFFASVSYHELFLQISILFLCTTIIGLFTYATKIKNFVKFLFALSLILFATVYLSYICSFDLDFALKSAFLVNIIVQSVLSLALILKSKYKVEKITFNSFNGLFLVDRTLANKLTLSVLLFTCILPSGFFKNIYQLLYKIYSFDKSGYFYLVFLLVIFGFLMLRELDLILNIYSKTKPMIAKRNKKTTSNDIAFLICLILLILFVFL